VYQVGIAYYEITSQRYTVNKTLNSGGLVSVKLYRYSQSTNTQS
jgi:hypothetical protein